MAKSRISNEIVVFKSLMKVYNSTTPTDSEMDCRYRWINEIIVGLWKYTDEDYSIEQNFCDVVIYDKEKNPVIIVETKALNKENEKSILEQLKRYAKSATRYLVGTNINFVWVWEIDSTSKKIILRVKFSLDELKKKLEKGGKIESILTNKEIQQLLFIYKLSKFIIHDSEIYEDFGILYHKVKISEPEGFEHLLLQTNRIINEILMEYALRSFDIYYKKYHEYSTIRESIESQKNQSSDGEELAMLERSLMKLNSDYIQYKDFGFEAWKIYSGRVKDSFEVNKMLFCKETIYVLLNKILFIRISEDKELIKPHLSNGGIETLREFITEKKQKYKSVINFAFNNAKNLYSHFYEPGILDWYIAGDGELDRILNRILWILNQFDFSDVNQDILGNLYEKYLPKEERKELGEFYTPVQIINYILDSIGYKGQNIRGKKTLDPACGSGGFLIQATKRLIKSFLDLFGKKSIKELSPSEANEILVEIIDSLVGWDINPFACHIAEMNILFQLIDLIKVAKDEPSFKFKRINIFHTDSLFEPISKNAKKTLDDYFRINERVKIYANEQKQITRLKETKYDFVIGNPPYVHLTSIPNELYLIYKTNYPNVAIGRTDLYILFLKLGLDLLKARGKLGFIVSDQFLIKKAGEGIKEEFLKKTKILEITDFQKFGQFLDATNYTAIIIVEKCLNKIERNENEVIYNYLKEEIPNALEILRNKTLVPEITTLKLSQKHLNSKEKWKYETSIDDPIISKILNSSSKTLSSLGGESKQGMLTGNDSVFIGKEGSTTDKKGIRTFIPLIEIKRRNFTEFEIEQELLKPIIHGRNVKRFSKINYDKYVLFYYKQDGIKTNVIPIDDIKREYPKCYNYLSVHKNDICSRKISRIQSFGDTIQWHRLTRPREFQIYKKGTIITPALNNYPNFTINKGGYAYVGGTAGVYGIILNEENLLNLGISRFYILGLLNSSVFSYYFRHKGAVKRGGYYQLDGSILDNTPILIPQTEVQKRLVSRITDLVKIRLSLEEEIDIYQYTNQILNQINLQPMMQSSLISQITNLESISEPSLLLEEKVVKVGQGEIRSTSYDFAKSIFLILKGRKWEESETPIEDLLTLKIPKTQKDAKFFIEKVEKFFMMDKENKATKEKVEREIDTLVLEVFAFSKEEINKIQEDVVEPWASND
ncbi:MAG: Eco57I restriction-modification methylase domain-containing protein [Candidatus Heimdallarchaeaceae archaeon]